MPAWRLMLSAFRVSVATLKESPLRTFLSTLGIVIGVGKVDSISARDRSAVNVARRAGNQTDSLKIGRGANLGPDESFHSVAQ